MSKFNLKNYKKINGDEHIESRLQESHQEAPDQINEKQLDKYRGTESEQITEKQLDKVRKGGADVLTEGRLSNDKSHFNIKYRNEDAHKGDINKLEEKRLKNKPVEDEKYASASETQKKLRWWEGVKSEDGLKLASTEKKIKKIAQEEDVLEEFQSETEKDMGDEFAVINDEQADDFEINNMMAQMDEDNEGPASMTIAKQKDIVDPIAGIYMVLTYSVGDFEDDNEIKKAAMDKVLEVRPNLTGLISIDDFGSISESGGIGKVSLRAMGDEFEQVVKEKADMPTELFEEIYYNTNSDTGTPMVSGKVKFDIVSAEGDKDKIIDGAIRFIKQKHPDADVTESSLDLSSFDSGSISFMAMVNNSTALPEVQENNDFPINVE